MGNEVGYHFVLEKAVIPSSIQRTVPCPVQLQWLNDGVACLYQPCQVAVALLDDQNRIVEKPWLADSNPRSWPPGEHKTEIASVKFSVASPGAYQFAVGLFLNRNDANPAYRLGIQGRTAKDAATVAAFAKDRKAHGGDANRIVEVCSDMSMAFIATHSRLEPMIKVAQTIMAHKDGVLRWFKSRVSNGLLEGINSLIQAAKAKARGYRSVRKPPNRDTQFTATWQVLYQPGVLQAVGYHGTEKVNSAEWHSAGAPTRIKLQPDRTDLMADGQDLSYITVELVDAHGIRHSKDENLVKFELEGPGTIVAVGNANPVSTESYQQPQRKAWQGRALVVVKSTDKSGIINLTAKTDGLPASELTIHAVSGQPARSGSANAHVGQTYYVDAQRKTVERQLASYQKFRKLLQEWVDLDIELCKLKQNLETENSQ